MRHVLCVLALFALIAAPGFAAQSAELIVPASFQPADQAQVRLDSMLYDYAAFELDTADLDQRVRTEGRLSLHLNNQRFDLELEPNDLRGPDYREVVMTESGPVTLAPRPLTTFKGKVAGDPDSVVRLSVAPDKFDGFIFTGGEYVWIDSFRSYSDQARAGQVVVYRDSAIRPEAVGECGVAHVQREARRMLDLDLFAVRSLERDIESSHQRKNVQVATDGDGQLWQRHGGNPGVFNFMSGVLNNVDGIYGGQLNLDVTVVYQQAWSSVSGDPYTSLNASTTLDQLRNWWNANNGSIARDVVHQFSGKDFSGGTIGIAYVGVICNAPAWAYGISEDQRNSSLNQKLTAHEIGHNLSANHDSSSCANCNGSGPIMCSFIQSSGSNTFSSCSKSEISNHVHNNGSCL